ncbi:MAG: LCP family protein [Lacisediminihabitans sp.]
MTELRPRSGRALPQPVVARHGRLKASNPYVTGLKFLAAVVAVVVASAAMISVVSLEQLNNNVKTVNLVGQSDGPVPDLGSYEGGFNVLVVGSDVCEDDSGCDGRGSAELNDVTMLLHVSADQTNAVAVSIPRDMVVPIPSCPSLKGKGNSSAMAGQPINVTLFYGGLPCTVLTVKALTGLDIQFAMEVKFTGIINITNAIGGVPVCVNGPINDRYSGFSVPSAGTYTLEGQQALAFLRTRHGLGDGSDLGRISGQQLFLSSMIKTLREPKGALSNPIELYKIASAVSENTIVSSNLKNPATLVSMANVVKKLDLSKVVFVQYPSVYGETGLYVGKVQPVPSVAAQLMARIKADQPVVPTATGKGTEVDAAAPATPGTDASAPATTQPDVSDAIAGLQGQTAAESTCAKKFVNRKQ